MTQAETVNTPSRRFMLAGTAALIAGAGLTAAAGTSPGGDAELIRLAERFLVIEWQRRAIFRDDALETDAERDVLLEPLEAEHEVIAARMEELPPTTMQGAAALARCAMLHDPHLLEDMELNQHSGQIVGVLLRALAPDMVVKVDKILSNLRLAAKAAQ